jgi:hypothetical protein
MYRSIRLAGFRTNLLLILRVASESPRNLSVVSGGLLVDVVTTCAE